MLIFSSTLLPVFTSVFVSPRAAAVLPCGEPGARAVAGAGTVGPRGVPGVSLPRPAGLASHRIARRIIAALLLCGVALLGGCSSLRLAYNQAERVGYWWLDGYFDFDDAQKPRVHAALAETVRWHRATQLPDHLALLRRARAEIVEPASAAQACHWFDDAMQRLDIDFEHVLPALAELAPTLSAQQLQHLERKYRQNDEKFTDDFLQDDPADRARASVKRVVERAEMLYGKLDREQRDRIAAGVAQSPFDAQVSFDERQRLHRDLLDTLRRIKADAAAPQQVQAALRGVMQRAKLSPIDAHRAYQQRLKQYNCAFAAQIHNATNAEQRQRAVRKIGGWEEDVRSLMASGD